MLDNSSFQPDHECSSKITRLALMMGDLEHQLLGNYKKTLEQSVFPYPVNFTGDKKALLKHQKKLRQDVSRLILRIIWIESEFVTAEDLEQVETRRVFDGEEMTQLGLARKLCSPPYKSTAIDLKELPNTNSHVRDVCLAAETYGLVNRNILAANRVALSGTAKLHIFMQTYLFANALILSQNSKPISPPQQFQEQLIIQN